jgi:hypothetical protein
MTMTTMTPSNWRGSFTLLTTACLGLIALADWLFYDHTLGWTTALFAAVLVCVMCIRSTRFLRIGFAGWILFIATLGMIALLVEEPTPLTVPYAILLLGTLALINANGWTSSVAAWVNRWVQLIVLGWLRPILDNRLVAQWIARSPITRVSRSWGIGGWILPVMLGGVFLGIFCIANPILSNWFERFSNWAGDLIERIPEILSIARILFWIICGLCIWALLRARTSGRSRDRGTTAPPAQDVGIFRPSDLEVEPALIVRCLLVFNAVFALQNFLDVRYLWFNGGELPPGMTYHEYAHRGSYPLVAAALLAAAFVLVTFRAGGAAERARPARRLVYLWLAQTALLTVSAAFRLGMYVEAYALTRLRLAAGIWMLLIVMGLVWIIWRIVARRSNGWLLRVNILTAAVVLYACAVFNFDGVIARFNIRHADVATGDGLDLEYFRVLGKDSLPVLEPIVGRVQDPQRRKEVQQLIDNLRAQLREETSDWRGWTFRRHRIEESSPGKPPVSVAANPS